MRLKSFLSFVVVALLAGAIPGPQMEAARKKTAAPRDDISLPAVEARLQKADEELKAVLKKLTEATSDRRQLERFGRIEENWTRKKESQTERARRLGKRSPAAEPSILQQLAAEGERLVQQLTGELATIARPKCESVDELDISKLVTGDEIARADVPQSSADFLHQTTLRVERALDPSYKAIAGEYVGEVILFGEEHPAELEIKELQPADSAYGRGRGRPVRENQFFARLNVKSDRFYTFEFQGTWRGTNKGRDIEGRIELHQITAADRTVRGHGGRPIKTERTESQPIGPDGKPMASPLVGDIAATYLVLDDEISGKFIKSPGSARAGDRDLRFVRKEEALRRAAVADKSAAEQLSAGSGEKHIDPTDITGVYTGQQVAKDSLMKMSLELEKAANGKEVAAVCNFYQPGGEQTKPLATTKLRGEYDAGKEGFSLKAYNWPVSRISGQRLAQIQGTFDPRTGKITGTLNSGRNQSTFEVARDAERTAARQAEESAKQRRFADAPISFWAARGDEERAAALLRWANRLAEEYPKEPFRTQSEANYSKITNLFADKYFVPVFGKPFDKFTEEERSLADRAITLLTRSQDPELRELFERVGLAQELYQPFEERGSFSFSKIAPAVAFRRTVRSEVEARMAEAGKIQPTAQGWSRLLELSAAPEKFGLLFPSEVARFETKMSEEKQRVADGVLPSQVDEVVQRVAGYEGARELGKWPEKNKELLKSASTPNRSAAMAKINQRLTNLIRPLVAQETARISQLGQGAAAVAAGNQWYRQFMQRFDFEKNHPAVREAIQNLVQRRGKDLAAARSAIEGDLQKARTSPEVDQTLARWLAVPGDQRTQAGAVLAEIGSSRKRRIALEEKFSEGEIALMKTRLGQVDVPAQPAQPTPEEIGLAFMRELDASGGEQIDRTTGHYSVPPASMFGIYLIMKIRNIRVVKSVPVGDGSYLCKYSLQADVSMPQKFLDDFQISSSPIHMQMMNAMTGELSGPHILIDQFVLTEDGWRSPTARSRGLKAMLSVQANWANSLNNALQMLGP
jgi:hypothetical protein